MSSPSQPEEAEGLTDGANDVVVVEQTDGALRATEFHVQARNKESPYCIYIKFNYEYYSQTNELRNFIISLNISPDWQVLDPQESLHVKRGPQD